MRYSSLSFLGILTLALSGGVGILFADSTVVNDSLKQLKEREAKVKALVERVMPSVVCVTSPQGGGTGSGVIVSKDGLILTAGHVTQATKEKLLIIFPDGRRVEGEALGANYNTDAGLARITEKGEWPAVEIGDSNKLKLGDWLVAMGHPGGFDLQRKPPVRLGRVWRRDNQGAVLSDCTLIGGDSGGPLFDLDGKVVGIHSSINSSASYNRHVAVDTFLGDWDDLMNKSSWGKLGDPEMERNRPRLGFEVDHGVQEGGAPVTNVPDNSPAAQAGLKVGDRIVKFDNVKIPNYWALFREISERKAGQKIQIEVKRGEELIPMELELLSREGKRVDDKPKDRQPREPKVEEKPRIYLGIGFDGSLSIDGVAADSPAEKAGLQKGDLILELDGKKFDNPVDFAEAISKHKVGDKISLKIKRGDKEESIELTLAEKK